MKIMKVHGRQVLDSRANPTVEAEVILSDGTSGRAIAPAGASKGKYEAKELRDGDPARWSGLSVHRAVRVINEIINKKLTGVEAALEEIDRRLIEIDGTPDKSRIGGNVTIAVSMAAARAISRASGYPLYEFFSKILNVPEPLIPTPMVNIISGGLHAGKNMDFQDFLVIPLGAKSLAEALDWIGNIYHSVRHKLLDRGLVTLIADEGGFGPPIKHRDALELLQRAMQESNLRSGVDVSLAIDVASSHFYDGEKYIMMSEGKILSSKEIVDLYQQLCEEYSIISIEDGCSEDDMEGWRLLTDRLGGYIQLIGDDLFASNSARIRIGYDLNVANAVLVKPNQVGTVTETLETIKLSRKLGYSPIISARSGDTEDTFIVDLAVGTGVGQIKIGSIARSERTAKYNRLLRLEERLRRKCTYAGSNPFKRFLVNR